MSIQTVTEREADLTAKVKALEIEVLDKHIAIECQGGVLRRTMDALKQVTAERDALRSDAERLDALGNLLNCTHSGDGGYFLELKFSYFASLHRLTLRQAIDAAMEGKS